MNAFFGALVLFSLVDSCSVAFCVFLLLMCVSFSCCVQCDPGWSGYEPQTDALMRECKLTARTQSEDTQMEIDVAGWKYLVTMFETNAEDGTVGKQVNTRTGAERRIRTKPLAVEP